MKLLRNNVLGGNKLNCFKATQVWGGLTQILIWGSEIAKSPTRSIKGGPGALASRGDLKFYGGSMNPNDAMKTITFQNVSSETQVRHFFIL